MFFKELAASALKKKTKPKQKKTHTQLSYEVANICTQVCSSLTVLVECVLFILTHAPLCAHLPLYIVLRVCYFGGSSPRWVLIWYNPAADSDWCWAPALSSHKTAPALSSLAVFCSTALSPERFESPQGRCVAVGRSLSTSGYICVWSLPRWQCNAVLCWAWESMHST